MGEERIDIAYPIRGKVVAVISLLSDNIQPNPNPESSYIKVIIYHIPSGFCVNSKFAYEEVENPLKLYRGENCVEVFLDCISNEARWLYHMFPEKQMKPVTREQ